MAPIGVALVGGGLFAKKAHMVRNPQSDPVMYDMQEC